MDAFRVLENDDPERFHSSNVNIFDMVLESTPMLPPYDLSQLESNLFLKNDAMIVCQVQIPLDFVIVGLCPSP